ncbi:formamidopyrimidine-DNA glycosylase [Pseudidiomarina salinarum]|uniref:Formamidopyrimidine-DNA glycosylase n=1 Tax=Pseudidiomarina salinarum TaxID=435908 RepID=A0A094ITV4_9GAMM|nr:bifunctional DNA-formamidopyrimidine glycosylase/DNA-(apurinic or apyrimidinic site) lyase [Pseudidiomarina salinarum]KFZ31105.1 formamidopyrimidine-DNA glycosylase [Pseudidiomarina salinarum]RUO71191.1 bifunctional DNA-formamidopyrimidine glycosylase/DNA-(apurinic or apyrimidinic site) lyase [Pseudidiomarina salinarum]
MPELPEVEVSRRGIEPHLLQRRITGLIVRDARLRWPVPDAAQAVVGETIIAVERRAKYLLIQTTGGYLIVHLGMSGKLRVVPADTLVVKHDHIDLVLDSGQVLRFNDPRRFGCWLYSAEDPQQAHPLLAELGPEPLTDGFDSDYLFNASRGRQQAVKTFLMDNHVVVGVGNIYANEALFKAGINPKRAAGKVSKARYEKLVPVIKATLAEAIRQGGTTLQDFTQADGQPGYFKQQLMVYGRGGKQCMQCKARLKEIRLGQRSTVYCTFCQR